MIILDNEYILITHDPVLHLSVSVWKKYTPSTAYREILILRFEAMLNAQINKEIADLRLLPTISSEDALWTVEISKKYYSLICKDAPHFSAIVLTEDTFTKLAMNSMVEEFGSTFDGMNTRLIARYFDNLEEAKKWLLE